MHDYIAEDNQQAASDLIDDLLHKIKKLADTGVTGSSRDHVKTGLRGFPYRKRCFYFRIVEDKMFLIRVLRDRQNTATQDFT